MQAFTAVAARKPNSPGRRLVTKEPLRCDITAVTVTVIRSLMLEQR